MFSVIKTATFDAAHYLPHYKGVCKNLHGHTYHVEVEIARRHGDIISEGPDAGMVIDLSKVGDVLKKTIGALDHTSLNEHPKLKNPTAENLACWIASELQANLPAGVNVIRCRVWETPTGAAEWRVENRQCE